MVAGLLVLVIGAAVVFALVTRNPSVGAFYDPPDELRGAPGTILRSEPFDDGLPDGARGWKVLYVSTDEHDQPIAVSGLVIVPTDPAPGPHPVLAWAHGTTGIARPCAPSVTDDPLEGIPDMTGPLERGWVITLTDYPGLGTPSPHPYLVGQSQGRAVLDSVRAAHNLDTGLDLDDRYAIWGHSQGGHAALFAGQLASAYLPDFPLVGVAALSPATRLQDNLAAVEGTHGRQRAHHLRRRGVDGVLPRHPRRHVDPRRSPARRPHRRLLPQPAVALPHRRRRAHAAGPDRGHRSDHRPDLGRPARRQHAGPDR